MKFIHQKQPKTRDICVQNDQISQNYKNFLPKTAKNTQKIIGFFNNLTKIKKTKFCYAKFSDSTVPLSQISSEDKLSDFFVSSPPISLPKFLC